MITKAEAFVSYLANIVYQRLRRISTKIAQEGAGPFKGVFLQLPFRFWVGAGCRNWSQFETNYDRAMCFIKIYSVLSVCHRSTQ